MRHLTPKRRALAAIEKETLRLLQEKTPMAVAGKPTPELDEQLNVLSKKRKEAEELDDLVLCFRCDGVVTIKSSMLYGLVEVRQLAIKDGNDERHVYFDRKERFHLPLCVDCALEAEGIADEQLVENDLPQ